jgi:hypothetical protein
MHARDRIGDVDTFATQPPEVARFHSEAVELEVLSKQIERVRGTVHDERADRLRLAHPAGGCKIGPSQNRLS